MVIPLMIAVGAFFLLHSTPNLDNRGTNCPAFNSQLSSCVERIYHSVPHARSTWTSYMPAIWKCNTNPSQCLELKNLPTHPAGCPSVPWRYCARPHPVGAWVTTPVDRDGPEPPGPGLVEEQPPNDGRVAIVDPLIGLLGMQVHLSKNNSFFWRVTCQCFSSSLLAGIQTFKNWSNWSLSFTDLQSELKLMGHSSMN